ncbi:MAG: hypothetical protein ABI639_06595 [Thermoanaerobaculia bacterium]
MVAVAPELFPPPDRAPDFSREVGVQVAHELSHMLRIPWRKKEMQVVRKKDVVVHGHVVEARSTGEDSGLDIGNSWRGAEQKTPLHRSTGRLDE